jgi:hypothetical protein
MARRPVSLAGREACVRVEDPRTVVRNQPHRRGLENPDDDRLGSAWGRFCILHKFAYPVHAAGEDFQNLAVRAGQYRGVTYPVRDKGIGAVNEPEASDVAVVNQNLAAMSGAINAVDTVALADMREMLLWDNDVPANSSAKDAAIELAIYVGRLSRDGCPYAAKTAA